MTRGIKILALALASFAVLWTTSFAEQQDAATPAEERTSSFAGEEPGELRVIEINGVSYRFRWAPPGTFTMGVSEVELEEACRIIREAEIKKGQERGDDVSEERLDAALKGTREWIAEEARPHDVTLTQGFWILETEVTQPMWESIMGNNPSEFQGAELPVERVSWVDCQKFIVELNKLEAAPVGSSFALPTEAQWEYACRAGTTTAFSWGDSLNGDRANCNGARPYGTEETGEFLGRTTPVGSYAANPWGLFDMHGNVREWCQDRFLHDAYPADAVTDPRGPDSGESRAARGGGWRDGAMDCLSARRHSLAVGFRLDRLGFRLALVPLAEETSQGAELPAQAAATPAEEWTASFAGQEAGDLRAIDVGGVSYRFRWAPPGAFTMGSSEKEQEEVVRVYEEITKEELGKRGADQLEERVDEFRRRLTAEETQRDVTLTQGFWILETEVTQLMWTPVMGYNPSSYEGANRPVDGVSWTDGQEFAAKLNELGCAPVGARFALPTDAQWEYACRAGTTTAFSWGDSFTGVEANSPGTYPFGTDAQGEFLEQLAPVGSYAANPWGLFDMHGNAAEWCEDVVEDDQSSADGSKWYALRSGFFYPYLIRSASRDSARDFAGPWFGLRLVLVPISE